MKVIVFRVMDICILTLGWEGEILAKKERDKNHLVIPREVLLVEWAF
jgi:hypothetical protein